MRVRGHGRRIIRTKVRGRTTSWWATCTCGWQAEHRTGTLLRAKTQHDEHKLEMFAQSRGVAVRRAYPTTEG